MSLASPVMLSVTAPPLASREMTTLTLSPATQDEQVTPVMVARFSCKVVPLVVSLTQLPEACAGKAGSDVAPIGTRTSCAHQPTAPEVAADFQRKKMSM